MIEADFRGLACPQPVMETKKAIEVNSDCDVFKLTVDNKAAVENLTRFLSHSGFDVTSEETGEDFVVTATRNGEAAPLTKETGKKESGEKNTLVMITGNRMGSTTPELGEKLMLSFVKTLPEMKHALWRVVFVNEGVRLAIEGAETLPVIQELEKSGISVLVCGTCLEFFGLTDQKKAGETTNMLDIVTSLEVADKIINM